MRKIRFPLIQPRQRGNRFLLGGPYSLLLVLFVVSLLTPAAEAARLPRIRIAPDGHGFVTKQGEPFIPMGVTYYRPFTGWPPQVWKKFDPVATRRDFARLKALGANCVRVFLSYTSFYRKPGMLSRNGLAKFDEFLKLAEEAGLYVQPTGLDGWEGTPAWARGDRYADERLLRAQVDFWKLFARRYRRCSDIFAFELLNEPAIHWTNPPMQAKWDTWVKRTYGSFTGAFKAWHVTPPVYAAAHAPIPGRLAGPSQMLLDYQHFREGLADAWTQRQVKAIKSVDPRALVTIGFVQWSVPIVLAGAFQYSAFRPTLLARFLDFMEIHFYPVARGPLALEFLHYARRNKIAFPEGDSSLAAGVYDCGNRQEGTLNLAYLKGVVDQVAQSHEPVVLGEFGWYGGGKPTGGSRNQPYPAATEAQQAHWCRRVVETTKGIVSGWLNWGLYDCPNGGGISQFSGLLKPGGAVKVWGRTFRQLATQFKQHPLKPQQLRGSPVMDWDRCITDSHARDAFLEKYYQAYRVDSLQR